MTEKVVTPTAFAALLGDLQTMAKAIDVNQERIEAGRSAEHKMQSGTEMAKSEEAKKKEEEDKKKKEHEEEERKKNAGGKGEMCKAFTMKAEDGTTVEVVDSSELIKSLTGRQDATDQNMLNAFEGVTALLKSQGTLLKSLTDKVGAQEATIKEQDTLIKSLKGDLDKVGSQGAGRRAVLSVVERTTASSSTTMAKGGLGDGVTVEDFFAKAESLQMAGKLTATDIAIAEASLNSGVEIPAPIISRVMNTAA